MAKTDRDYERECLDAELAMGAEVTAENARLRALRDVPPVTLAETVDDAWDAFDTLEPITMAECNEQIAEREATQTLREALES